MTVYLHIDRLVLDGVPVSAHAGPTLSAAVEGELTRLIQAGGLDVAPGFSVPRVHAGSVMFEAAATPAVIGARIAGALFDGLSHPLEAGVERSRTRAR